MISYDVEVRSNAHFLPLDYCFRARTILSAAFNRESFIKNSNFWISTYRCCYGERTSCLFSWGAKHHGVPTSSFAVMNAITQLVRWIEN